MIEVAWASRMEPTWADRMSPVRDVSGHEQ